MKSGPGHAVMLKAENISKSFGTQVLFEDVTFNVNAGERIGLVGRNGHGKTTLLRILAGIEEADAGAVTSARGYSVGYLDQRLAFTEPTLVAEACLGLPASARDQRWRAEKVLTGLGFTLADMERSPWEFSGGYQVRLNLAKLLLRAPDLLLLDEPTNYLDIVAIRWLERFFLSWKGEIVLVTHDRSFMDRIATHVMGIHRRRLRKMAGNTAKYYEQIDREEEVHEKSRLNLERKRQQTEDFIRRFRAKARLVGLVQSRIRTLEKQEMPERLDAIAGLDFSFRCAPLTARVIGEVDRLGFAYDSTAPRLFQGLNLSLGRHDRIGVIGPNGRGKTTLLRILAGELAPTEGEVRVRPDVRVGYYGQTNVDRLEPGRTVVEEILSVEPERSVQRARAISGAMMFEGDAALKRIAVLSGGERSRVLLGKLLTSPINLLLLDEPTNHLDMDSAEALLAALEGFDGAVVIVTHNERYLHALANRLVVFDGAGASVFEGGYADFLEKVGWTAETPGGETTQPVGASEESRKDARRARAELVQERSRQLRPLEERVGRIEERLLRLEGEAHQCNHDLVQASVHGDAEAIARGGREIKRLSAEIEAGYEELCEATEALERASVKWKGRMTEEG